VRTVIVYPAADRAACEAVLDRLGPGQRVPWHIAGCLHVDVTTGDALPLFYCWDPAEVSAVEATVGHRPTWAVHIDVSWSVDGKEPVRRLVLALLEAGGAAVDDNSTHPWTGAQIAGDARVGGRRFFNETP
jgi:hypothetical protein